MNKLSFISSIPGNKDTYIYVLPTNSQKSLNLDEVSVKVHILDLRGNSLLVFPAAGASSDGVSFTLSNLANLGSGTYAIYLELLYAHHQEFYPNDSVKYITIKDDDSGNLTFVNMFTAESSSIVPPQDTKSDLTDVLHVHDIDLKSIATNTLAYGHSANVSLDQNDNLIFDIPAGPKGDRGNTGPVGPKGDKGEPGIQGPQGIQGPVGKTGPTGPQGPVGPKGDKGDIGPQGPAGPKGDKGDTGYSAYQSWLNAGNKGTEADFVKTFHGIQGPRGETGPKGETGANFYYSTYEASPNQNTMYWTDLHPNANPPRVGEHVIMPSGKIYEITTVNSNSSPKTYGIGELLADLHGIQGPKGDKADTVFQEAQQASLDTSMMYGESLPPYFQNSFNHVTQGIPSGNDVLNIATISDAHWQEDGATIFDGYTAKSLEHYQWCALSTLYNHADALIALGDNINGDEPTGRLNMTLMHVRAMLQTKYVRTAMFMIRGNHDNGAGHQNTEGNSADEVLDDNAIKNGFGTKLNYYGEVRDGDSLYFYKDFPEKKVRIIGLDSNDIPLEKKDSNGHYAYATNTAGFRSQQLNWFANKALMLPDNTWQVVVFFHIPFPSAFRQWAEDNTFKNYHHAIAILNAFKNGTSVNINDTSNPDFTITGLQADYSKQGQGTLIAVVNGHLHCDDQDTSVLNGTPIIEVTTSASFVSSIVNDSKQRNTKDEDAWDLISINTKERKIHCYRFGRGSDRDFTY